MAEERRAPPAAMDLRRRLPRRALLGAAGALALGGGSRPAAASAPFAEAELAHARDLRERGLADRTAHRLVRELCTGIGARPAGSPEDAKARAWAMGALTALGLENVRAEAFPLRVWRRGPAAARLTAPQPRPLVMAALGNSVATPAGGLDAEVAWYPSLAALRADTTDREQSRANGRIVFIDERTARTRDGRGYGNAVLARINGPVEAARRGAVALAIRSIGTSGEAGSGGSERAGTSPVAHTGATRYDLSVPRIPAFAVSVPDAEYIAAWQASGQMMRMHVDLQTRSGVDASTANVIAEWRGTDLADEVVLISAHLDTWDVGEGAEDDGAGVGIVCAAAGLMASAKRRARRTIRVVLFGNEENGFDGALQYGNRYKDVPHQLVAESDFGAGRIYAVRSRVAPAALPVIDAMAEVLAPLEIAHPEATRNQGNPGPDAGVLMRRHRWPAIALSQDGSRYFDVHHTVHDMFEHLDTAGLPQNVAAWAVTAWLAAQSPLPFGPPVL
ncbi:MAG: M28 family peptidase [Rubrivivax sp.]|nr:M28 family peptidase [Rubrivivax sp.]